MPFCETSAILREYPPGVKIDPLPCKRWSCPDCCHKRRARLTHEAHRGKPNTFLTLTVNPAVGTGPDHRARLLKESWTKIHRQAKKLQPDGKLPFLAVFELTKAGEPHLHILCRSKWIDQKWLSERMEEEMGAPIVDIRRIDNPKSASLYVSKYVSKNPERFPGTKRYWRTQDYFVLEKEEFTPVLGKPIRQWWMKGEVDDIARDMSKYLYEYQHLELPEGSEHWLIPVGLNLVRAPEESPKSQLDLLESAPPGASELRGGV